MRLITITENEFAEQYQPIRNHLDPNAAFDWGQGYGTMFETYGDELAFVRSQPTAHIWTFISVDGWDCITSGFHFVNRLGYFVTVKPVPTNSYADVKL